MNVLIGCEESGTVREEFLKLGHNAWSCDILPSRIPGNHYQCDIREVLHAQAWDLGIFFPPCTRLANSGVRWLRERNLWDDMREGAEFFKMLWESGIPRIGMENPIPHKYALEIIGVKYTQIVQPWMFGHPESKATCLWLKNLPPLRPTRIVKGRKQRIWKMSPSPTRARDRSVTYKGIARAMANQWSINE